MCFLYPEERRVFLALKCVNSKMYTCLHYITNNLQIEVYINLQIEVYINLQIEVYIN